MQRADGTTPQQLRFTQSVLVYPSSRTGVLRALDAYGVEVPENDS